MSKDEAAGRTGSLPGFRMKDVPVSTNGVLIHTQSDWPCSWCRPDAWSGLGANLLCLDCAITITAALASKLADAAAGQEWLPEDREPLPAEGEPNVPGIYWNLFGPRYLKR